MYEGIRSSTVVAEKSGSGGEYWGAIGAIGAAAIAAIVGPIVAEYLKRKQQKDEAHFKMGLEEASAVYVTLQEFLTMGADRVILWAGHNGGGIPSASSPFFVSSIHGVVREEYLNLIQSYRNITVDLPYIHMLLEGLSSPDRTVINTLETMPPCQLRKYYEVEGVVEGICIVLGVVQGKLIYLSVASHKKRFTEKQITRIQLKANDLWEQIRTGKKH